MPHPILTPVRRAAMACAALVFAGCSESTVPPEIAENAPAEFSYNVSAAEPGVSTDVRMEGAYVVVTHRESIHGRPPSTRRVRVAPTAGDWAAFWAAVDAAGVRQWTGHYEAEGFRDGAGWSLRLAGNGVTIDTYGTNAWPDRDGNEHELQRTPEFSAFLDALESLTGWEF